VNYAILVPSRSHGPSRLLSHLASDEALNEPEIDLLTSVAVVDAILLDYPLSPSEYLRVAFVVPSAVCTTLIQLPDFGSWSMSPSRISASGTCSVTCSELTTLPDRRDRSAASTLR